ncbi:MAG: amino acid adenylation domain-containing protein [Thermoanaerobaculia bacterium]
MKPAPFEDVYELSPMQQGILFHTLYDPAADHYFKQSVLTLRGDLDGERFAQAWQRVAARHVILRTSFHWEGLEKPVQVVHPNAQVPVESLDCRGLSLDAQQHRLEVFLLEDRKKGFDLASQPLLRVTLLRTAEDLHECVLSYQHLVLDRWSRSLVLREVFTEYAAGSRGEDAGLSPAGSYGEYIAWIQGTDRSGAEAFWRSALAGFTRPTSVRLDERSGTPSAQGFEEASIRLSPQASATLQSFARRHRLTLNTLIQGAWAVLASRYSGEEDVLFGATVSGRPASLPDVESMVGLFINTLPVRVRVPQSGKLIDWLRRLQEEFLELRQYEHSSLVDIQGWSEVPRGTPLFESLLVFENVGGDFDSVSGDGPLKVLRFRSLGGWTNYPLTLLALPGERLFLRILSDRSLFDAPSITRMLGHLLTLLEGMAADPEQPLSRLPLLTPPERRQLLYDWNQTSRAFPHEKTVHGLFEEQAQESPDAQAVVFDRQRLSYRELNERANRLARFLRRLGVGPDVLVGLGVERSVEMVVGILGILKAGGAYVPLDPHYPRERVAFMLEDSGVAVLLTQRSLADGHADGPFKRVNLDTERVPIEKESGENLESGARPENLVYVIYTSGSTGLPKGVAIEHRNTVALLTWAREFFHRGELKGVLASTSVCFDLSVFELFAPLVSGGSVILSRNVLELAELAARSEVTLVNTVPSAMAGLLRIGGLPESVATVNLAGEPLATALVDQIAGGAPARRVFDLYGPTEDTTYSTCALRDAGGAATIGRPISNKRAYILDCQHEPVPRGVEGDLYVAGAGVARGYLNRPELTREMFLPDPFHPGERMYRTGDRARFLPDGNLQFVGRLDQQIKIRGYRIEIGEIETVLSAHPDVRECAVAARRDPSSGDSLVAYVVWGAGRSARNDLRLFLKRSLPDYMIPSDFLFLDSLPLTPNGKLDRKALPAPERKRPVTEDCFVAPRTSVEDVVAGIWAEVLGLQRVGVEDDFFVLGGHSLLGTQIISRVREACRVELPLRALFESRTVAGLAREIENMRSRNRVDSTVRLRPVSREGRRMKRSDLPRD